MPQPADPDQDLDWTMPPRAGLLDWPTASRVGTRLAGRGPTLTKVERARIVEDFAELVPEAEKLVREFTGLSHDGYRARSWVMNRGEWIDANLRGFQRVIEPLAARALTQHGVNPRGFRRKILGAQVGSLMGYVSRKVLGQFDLFLPPDDDGLIYFVGPNVAEVEQRFGFPKRDFRMWLCLHETAHRVQFGSVPWLKDFLTRQIESYLSGIDIDPKRVLEAVRRAIEEVRTHGARGADLLPLLMTPEQREVFDRMQGLMSLLEGHATFVMDILGAEHLQQAERMRTGLQQRRKASAMERGFQRMIGFDKKISQYDTGRRFVAHVVERAGMPGFNRVWEAEANLPTAVEVARPDDWLARVSP
ncbi:MAG: zinc-dependent metalloprotease [Actinomycetota bacterium]